MAVARHIFLIFLLLLLLLTFLILIFILLLLLFVPSWPRRQRSRIEMKIKIEKRSKSKMKIKSGILRGGDSQPLSPRIQKQIIVSRHDQVGDFVDLRHCFLGGFDVLAVGQNLAGEEVIEGWDGVAGDESGG